jgi:hypothetical protein
MVITFRVSFINFYLPVFYSSFPIKNSITNQYKAFVAQYVRHCATRRKVAGSMAEKVNGNFH